MIMILGALLGFIAVAFGAYAEHGLREVITEEQFRYLMTAIRYNQVHAVITVAVGLAAYGDNVLKHSRLLRWSGMLFIAGTVFFSFSIYLSVTLAVPQLLYFAPLGGMTIMAAWLVLCLAGVVTRSRIKE